MRRRVFKPDLGLTHTWVEADCPALKNVGLCALVPAWLGWPLWTALLLVWAGLRISASSFFSPRPFLSRCLPAEEEWGSFLP